VDDSVKPYDDTTLFCPAGMQQFKDKFKNPDNTSIANSQSCIRLQDLDEIGDGSHLLYFNMLGLFSFGELTMQQTIHFWMKFF
jgi:alanyl-tRNA synthetase